MFRYKKMFRFEKYSQKYSDLKNVHKIFIFEKMVHISLNFQNFKIFVFENGLYFKEGSDVEKMFKI
jgi:hypothetical protein